jgi:hypothetical protein
MPWVPTLFVSTCCSRFSIVGLIAAHLGGSRMLDRLSGGVGADLYIGAFLLVAIWLAMRSANVAQSLTARLTSHRLGGVSGREPVIVGSDQDAPC